jgi:predicted 3-demethylubiquinone-9 3-methyltransferase (glyoxalase superfamily)
MSNYPAPNQPNPAPLLPAPPSNGDVKRQWYIKKRVYLPVYAALTILLFASFFAGGNEETPATANNTPAVVESESPATEAAPEEPVVSEEPAVEEEPVIEEEPVEPEYTASQENAIAAAENYVDIMPFSKAGLVRQLSSPAGDGYSKADARFAVNHIEVNWKSEAFEAAQNYQDIMPMSRDGLIQQLTADAGDKFTHDQAVYAVDKLGL